jgi:hypothetical protein
MTPLADLQAFTDRLLNRIGRNDGPPGTTHVIDHVPAELLDSSHPCFPAEGYWQMWMVRDFTRGYCNAGNDPESIDGPADMAEEDLRSFAEEMLGAPVMLTRIDAVTVAYWITPERN